jgi:phosphoribosylformylglycinamidine synthase
MMIRAKVDVSLKEDVSDPQGNAVGFALANLGHTSVRRVRVGRHFDLLLEEEDLQSAQRKVKEMCDALLANTVIERYDIRLEPANGEASR